MPDVAEGLRQLPPQLRAAWQEAATALVAAGVDFESVQRSLASPWFATCMYVQMWHERVLFKPDAANYEEHKAWWKQGLLGTRFAGSCFQSSTPAAGALEGDEKPQSHVVPLRLRLLPVAQRAALLQGFLCILEATTRIERGRAAHAPGHAPNFQARVPETNPRAVSHIPGGLEAPKS